MATNPWQREGDAWLERNRQALSEYGTKRADWLLWLLEQCAVTPRRVLEVGCSNGWRLELIRKRYDARCFGLDVSPVAIREGEALFPQLQLDTGEIGQQFGIASVDLIICSYVLHCLERPKLLATVAEIDRILSGHGHLLLADFAPDYPCKVPWRDSVDVWTYKLPSICDVFIATGLYRQVAHLTLDHDTQTMTAETNSDRRGFVALLKKESRYKEV